MKRTGSSVQSYVALAAVVLLSGYLAINMGGCPLFEGPAGPAGEAGPAGPVGPQGPTGPAGLSAGDTLAETVVTIKDVNAGTSVAVGDPLSVTFTIQDDAGLTIPIESLTRFSIYVSGPSNNYQRVIVPEPSSSKVSDVAANITTNADGSYTYKFATPFPSVYAGPVNKPAGAALVAGELTGQAITPGTHTVGIEARRDFTVEGVTIRKAGDATFNFSVGGAALEAREVITLANCNQCHSQLAVHGENRHLTTGCVLCHTNGALDSAGGESILLSDLVHKLHRGSDLPTITATKNGTDPYKYEVAGFRGSVVDFSDVKFPWMPGGTGFNKQTRNCAVCHSGAAQGDKAYASENIVQAKCSTCHSDIDFDLGTILDSANATVAAGTLTQAQLTDPAFRTRPGGVNHELADAACTLCHGAGTSWDVATIHTPPAVDANNLRGLTVQIQSITGNATPGYFVAGEIPTVVFQILDANNNPVAIEDVWSISMVLSGTPDNYQKILPTSGGSAVSIKSTPNNGGAPTIRCTPSTGVGPFTYVSTAAIPATVPTQAGNTGGRLYADGWGNLGGLPLPNGPYTMAIWTYRTFAVDGTTYRETTSPALATIQIGAAGADVAYSGIVTDAKCNACHGDLRFHGNGRKTVAECVLCHVAGTEAEAETVDFKVMIHKIHAAWLLTAVTSGGSYEIGNADFSTGLLPTMPGGPKDCVACHATDAWKAPIANANVNIWKVACTSCHDSSAANSHAELNTLGLNQESCEVCHGAGAFMAVEAVHANP